MRARTFALAVAAALAGCVNPDLVPCGDLLCPTGTVCVGGSLCATQGEIDACAGLADQDRCAVNGRDGVCAQGVCVSTVCGNNVVDADETCDDGNTLSGDGCRGDCGKVELCGDAIADEGEDCDDGNTNPADHCDACAATSWQASVLVGGSVLATSIGINFPSIALDRAGNLFIADSGNYRVRRVDTTGVITTIGGTGVAGFSGDGGVATSAQFANLEDIAVDGLGRVYVTDESRVRRIDSRGIIDTIAGTGVRGSTGDGGPAVNAQVDRPSGVAVDGLGNVYIAEPGRVRRIDPAGIITTFAGTGVRGFSGDGFAATAAQLDAPIGLRIDAQGNVYIADNPRIRRVTPAGIITTVAGGGTGGDGGLATAAQLNTPYDMAIDASGVMFIADASDNKIRRVDTNGIITTFAGNGSYGFSGDGGPATSAELWQPRCVDVDSAGHVYIADAFNSRVRRVSAGTITTVAGNGSFYFGQVSDGVAATTAPLQRPSGLGLGPNGSILIGDSWNNRVRAVSATGVFRTIAGYGAQILSGDGGPAIEAGVDEPHGVTSDAQGNVYIADTYGCRIRKVDANGIITTFAGNDCMYDGDGGLATSANMYLPAGLVFDAQGNLFIADSGDARIRRIDTNGIITTVAGIDDLGYAGDNGPAIAATLDNPNAIAFDAAGNLFIADEGNHTVRRVDANGVITTVAGTGTAGFSGDGAAATSAMLDQPAGVAFDSAGYLYIADAGNNRIRRVAPNGTITTFAGTGVAGFLGDGGSPVAAQLDHPCQLVVDAQGALYVADQLNDRIRRIRGGVITTLAGQVEPDGAGPIMQAAIASPRAMVLAGNYTFFAGGASGTVQAVDATAGWLGTFAGRYPHAVATGSLARFRTDAFGTVEGVAYDPASKKIYLTETSSNRIQAVDTTDPDPDKWTIATLANGAGTAGFVNGAISAAKFRAPTGLFFDATTTTLYVADTGNHVIRAITLAGGTANATVTTVAGTPATRGYFGDAGAATSALIYGPRAITRCANGDLFIADTGNNRVRRVTAAGTISTVLGDGVAASSGEGVPATTFPVDAPLGLACDALGNLFVTSTTAVRLLPSGPMGAVDGSGEVETIYGLDRTQLPASITRCLTGVAAVDATTVEVVDSCTGLLVQLRRTK